MTPDQVYGDNPVRFRCAFFSIPTSIFCSPQILKLARHCDKSPLINLSNGTLAVRFSSAVFNATAMMVCSRMQKPYQNVIS